MKNYICITCGTQFAKSKGQPAKCPICEDERQYVNPDGQQWTTLEELRRNHRNLFGKKEPQLYGIASSPKIGIGQRGLAII